MVLFRAHRIETVVTDEAVKIVLFRGGIAPCPINPICPVHPVNTVSTGYADRIFDRFVPAPEIDAQIAEDRIERIRHLIFLIRMPDICVRHAFFNK